MKTNVTKLQAVEPPKETPPATPAPAQMPRLLRREVEQRTALGRSAIYDLMARGLFPRPVKVGPGSASVRWVSTDIDAWIADRIASARAGGRS